jgi:hypothetical protein
MVFYDKKRRMMLFRRIGFYVIIFIMITACQQAAAQSRDTLFLRFPDSLSIPEKLVRHISKMKPKFREEMKADAVAVNNVHLLQMLQQLETGKDYQELLQLRYRALFQYREMIPELILRLRNKTFIGLESYNDLMILERIRAGHMKNYGQGITERNDLFTLAGRSNWLLREITGENFGTVSMYSSVKDLTRLQERWINWLNSLVKTTD